jgi:hypothetical protein
VTKFRVTMVYEVDTPYWGDLHEKVAPHARDLSGEDGVRFVQFHAEKIDEDDE